MLSNAVVPPQAAVPGKKEWIPLPNKGLFLPMNSKRSGTPIAGKTIFIVLLCLRSLVFAAEPTVILSHSTVAPGDTLRVILGKADSKVQYKIRFREKTYPVYPIGVDAERALIGIALGSTFGIFPLDLKRATRDGWRLVKSFQIEVSSITYATENVNFTPQKTALMKMDHVESSRIGRMLKTPTAEQQWKAILILLFREKPWENLVSNGWLMERWIGGFIKGWIWRPRPEHL